MDKKVTDNSKLFTLFRQSGEVSFIKFLDKLGENNVKETSNTNRSKRSNDRISNRRQKQDIPRNETIRKTSISSQSSEEIIEV